MTFSKINIQQACIQKQTELIESFQNRVDSMQADVLEANQSPSQTEDRIGGKVELFNAVGKELDFAIREMDFLETLQPEKQCTIVEPGALVITDKLTLYICVSIEQIEVDGHTIFGISTRAPIYAAMRGLEKGQSFKFNETEYEIKDIN
ncbi:hypothetical protein FFWV33_17195 [Flavobacterium faecale]|uniref:Transcription elongation factor GreA/GreB C-terminal domain-containing protein n=1 Tax=Flavobacterium faecale TaxID=1355330 RepID=A0A2S1LH78_9FLAO|nr:hypothetical protein [Flavobacterium faecale]AWG23140.1 hypothetical protein FFWV33_17195 [Flavobacterium faecale]